MNYGQLIDRVLSLAGSDLTRAEAGQLINDAHRELCALSQWTHVAAQLGVVASGQAAYPLPSNVVDVRRVAVCEIVGYLAPGDPLAEYERVGPDQLAGLKSGRLSIDATDAYAGVFAPTWDYIYGSYVELFPAPDSSLSGMVVGWGVALPGDLTDEANSVPAVPLDYHPDIARRAHAEGLILYDERSDLAAPILQAFEARAEQLRRRRNSQVGSGSFRAAIVGVDG